MRRENPELRYLELLSNRHQNLFVKVKDLPDSQPSRVSDY
ncbi:MAG: hypothetical protein [Olavius algarvensis Delta 4 endosymbiont]|nr:MAG: hypothetical protein [Olavius algarvensis Delta 4 endosymbiont]